MSNALAIATVTTALAQIVRTAVQAAVPGSDVLTERPTGTPPGGPRVRLFLHQVSPNAAFRNNDLPTRAAKGSVVNRPTAALDLHYLLAFYGNETELEPQRMLGAVVRDIHAKPVLVRQMIEDAVTSAPFLTGSNLADAVEQVKFSPLPLSLDELSKLWTVFFQAPYALSVAYQGTVVLIETEDNVSTVLPVLRRGTDDQGVNTVLGPFPTIDSVHIGAPEEINRRPRQRSYRSAQLGSMLTIIGQNLGGEMVTVHFTHQRPGVSKSIVVPASSRSHTELNIALPNDVAAQTEWSPGLYAVQVSVKTGGSERATDLAHISFAPKITQIAPPSPVMRDGSGSATLTVTCVPQVRAVQRATMLIAGRELLAQPHPVDTDTLQFVVEHAPVVTDALVWIRIDGVNSLPFVRRSAPLPSHLVFDEKQKVTIS